MTGRLLTVGKPDHPCVLPRPKPTSGNGAVWQCDTCWKLWRYESIRPASQGWHRIADPKTRLIAERVLSTGIWRLIDPSNGSTYARIDHFGHWVDETGKPAVDPDLARIDAEHNKPRMLVVEGKHARATGDTSQLHDMIQTVKDARFLIEDQDATKTALGLIVIVLVVVSITVSILALTGQLS